MTRVARAAMFAGLAAFLAPGTALGCLPNPDPDLRPWGERVAGANPMFIGTVTEIRGEKGQVWIGVPDCKKVTPECDDFYNGLNLVVFTVELPINGDLALGDTFVLEQGYGSDCRIPFQLGQRWLFAGNFLESPSMYLNEAREGLN